MHLPTFTLAIEACAKAFSAMRSLLVRMRNWVDGRGGGGPFPNEESLPDMTEEQVVDRYHQHTKDCPSCSVVRSPPTCAQ